MVEGVTPRLHQSLSSGVGPCIGGSCSVVGLQLKIPVDASLEPVKGEGYRWQGVTVHRSHRDKRIGGCVC